MDALREKLPPSPPMTDSSTKSSPPSLLPTVSPSAETPPLSPDTSRSNNSSSPRLSSPLSPLPPEVFLAILRFLPSRDQIRATLVSKTWHTFIVNEPGFWSRAFVRVEYDDLELLQRMLFRAVGNGNKKREGLKELTLKTYGSWDRQAGRTCSVINRNEAMERLGEVIALAQYATLTQGPDNRFVCDPVTKRYSTLRNLNVNFASNHPDTIYFMNELSKQSGSALFHDLDSFRFEAAIPLFNLTSTILFMFPKLRHLSLKFPRINGYLRPVNHNGFVWSHPQNEQRPATLENLRILSIEGAIISEELILPMGFPVLTHLTLHNVRWQGKTIFRLLRLARRTLTHLELCDFSFDPANDEEEEFDCCINERDPDLIDGHIEYTDPRDPDIPQPPPIILPSLLSLTLTGSTPPLFTNLQFLENDVDVEEWPTPIFLMPKLVRAHFDDLQVDPETFEDYTLSPLPTFGRNAPNVEHLAVTTCIVSDEAVFSCLAAMSARIRSLDFYDSSVSDTLLSRLPHLTPRLAILDVRQCNDVTCQGIARLVEVLRHLNDEGEFGLKEVYVEQPQYSDYDWRAYRWLDFIGVLKRDDSDWEGKGPSDEKERREWIREGKKDMLWEWKEAMKKKDEQEAEMRRLAAAQQLEMLKNQVGGSGSSSMVASGGAASFSKISMPTTFAPPPPHLNYTFPTSTFVLPLPSIPDAPTQQYHRQQQAVRYAVPAALPSSTVATAVPTTVPSAPAPVQSQESKLDLTSLDSIEDLGDLDPALVREQQLIMQQLERSRQHSGGGGGGGHLQRHTQEEAYAVARRYQEAQVLSDRQQEQDDRDIQELEAKKLLRRSEQAISAVTGAPPPSYETDQAPGGFIPPRPAPSRMAGLEHVRKGFAVDQDDLESSDDEEVEPEPKEDDGEAAGEFDGEDYYEDDEDMLEYEEIINETDAKHPSALR